MKNEQTDKLKELILKEISLRQNFKRKQEELESLVDPITKHVDECCKWWKNNLPNVNEVVVIMDNKTTLRLSKPKKEVCSVEIYLPYGIDFEECLVIDVTDK